MKQDTSQGIILARTNYGEADRILKFLTPDFGKISAIAKGVRKSKSKLAGSIELFSVSDLSFISGRSEIYTLTSARLVKHYSNIVKDLERTNLAYEFIRIIDKATEDKAESDYFKLINQTFEALDDSELDLQIIQLWFGARLIKLAGRTPNLKVTNDGQPLQPGQHYTFDFNSMHFNKSSKGTFATDEIKFLRLCFAASQPYILQQVQGSKKLAATIEPLIYEVLQNLVRA